MMSYTGHHWCSWMAPRWWVLLQGWDWEMTLGWQESEGLAIGMWEWVGMGEAERGTGISFRRNKDWEGPDQGTVRREFGSNNELKWEYMGKSRREVRDWLWKSLNARLGTSWQGKHGLCYCLNLGSFIRFFKKTLIEMPVLGTQWGIWRPAPTLAELIFY